MCAIASGLLLLVRRYALARAAAIAQVPCLLAGWGAAQYPFVLRPSATITSTAAPRATLLFVVWTLPIAVGLVLPAMALLFSVFKRSEATRDRH